MSLSEIEPDESLGAQEFWERTNAQVDHILGNTRPDSPPLLVIFPKQDQENIANRLLKERAFALRAIRTGIVTPRDIEDLSTTVMSTIMDTHIIIPPRQTA